VTQVPAFSDLLAAGLLVTRTSVDSDLPGEIIGQMFIRPEAMGVSAVFLGALSFTGLPKLPLMVLASGLSVMGVRHVRETARPPPSRNRNRPTKKVQEKPAPKPEDNLFIDPMELELGFGLIRLADSNSGGDLLDRVTRVRHKIAQELGMILPKVRIRDNIRLDQRQYQIKIHDVAVAWGTIFADGLLAIDSGATSGKLPGVATTEPAFGRPAIWIETTQRERAELLGYSVVEPSACGRHAPDRGGSPAQRRTAVAAAGAPVARQPEAAFSQDR